MHHVNVELPEVFFLKSDGREGVKRVIFCRRLGREMSIIPYISYRIFTCLRCESACGQLLYASR